VAGCLGEGRRVRAAVDAVRQEQSAEKQNFRRQENPHPKLRHVLLLAHIGELRGGANIRHFVGALCL
jgi:hypothetical protein